VGVEHVEVRVERPQRLHLGGVAHASGLYDLAAGAAGRLLAIRRTLVPVKLEQREAAQVRRGGHLVERRVHEHSCQLHAAVQLRADRLRMLNRARARAVGPEDHPERPGPQLDRLVGVVEHRDAADLHAGHGPPMVAELTASLRRGHARDLAHGA
jgi:hypothetical protein